MKQKHVLVAFLVLGLGFFFYGQLSRRVQEAPQRTVDSDGPAPAHPLAAEGPDATRPDGVLPGGTGDTVSGQARPEAGTVPSASSNVWPSAAPVAGAAGAAPFLDLPDDFLNRIVTGEEARFALPDGRSVVGRVEMVQRDAQGIVMVQGRFDEPAPGFFFFQRQTVSGVAGRLVGNVRFDHSDAAWKVTPSGPGGAPRLVSSNLDGVICANFAQRPPEAAEGDKEYVPQNHPSSIPIPSYQTVIPLQSLPGATGVIYLDFDGETGPFSGWGSFDAAPSGATNSQVLDVWKMVSEDYTPFNLNVTTDRRIYDNAAQGRRIHVIISPTTTAAPGAGGVAYVGSFNWSGDTPCWAFYSTGKSSCEVISHEVGHTLGLSHDGRISPSEGYYGGHGTDPVGWAPIMGVGYYKNLSQWSKGEYLSANNTEDDLSIIANNNNDVDYRADDFGETLATAGYLEISGSNVVSNEGIIGTSGDVDAFRFVTSGGLATLNVNSVTLNPDLDISAEVVDAATGSVMASNNPDAGINAAVSVTLAAGEYLLKVKGTGRGDPLGDGYTNYGCLGAYLISGSVVGGVRPDRFSIAENPANGAAVGTVAPRLSHGASTLTYAIASGNGSGAFAINSGTGALTVSNNTTFDFETLSLRWDDPATFELFVTITDSANSSLNESIRVVVTVTDVNEAPTMAATSATLLEHTRAGTNVVKLTATDLDHFDFPTYSITAGNTGNVFAINAGTGQIVVAANIDVASNTVYNLTVQAADQMTPTKSVSVSVPITVINITDGYEPGRIVRTYFENISGSTVANLTGSASFPNTPSSEQFLASFDGLSHGDNFGSTIRGYFIPPTTGPYQFWIASDDASELRLSTNATPASATVIASVSGWTNQYAWTANSSQQSSLVTLTAGQPYYIEARHKEGGGGDHVAVAFTGPGLSQQIIPGTYLAPFYQNYAPKVNAATLAVREDAFAGQPVGTATASDVNAQDTYSGYTITGGNTGGLFGIVPATGQIYVAQAGLMNATTTPSYTLTVQVTDNGTPALNGTGTVTVNVRAASTLNVTGIVQQVWTGVSGSTVANLTGIANYPYRPSYTRPLTSGFDSGTNLADNYGSRIRALVVPPATGTYTFFLASDDDSKLLLGTNATAASASVAATISGWTNAGEWTKYTSQTSAAVNLVAGQSYYIETLQKEGGGGDHVQVGWTGPDYATTTIIPASALLPYDINVAPSFGAGSYSFTTNDFAANGTTVGTVAATDPEGETVFYRIVSGNTGGAFAISTGGLITVANATALAPGTFNLTVSAQDGGIGGIYPLRSVSVPVTVVVQGTNHVPVWGSTNLTRPAANEGAAYSATLVGAATDEDASWGDTLSYSKVSGPGWLVVAADGTLSGTPPATDRGTDSFVVRASDTHSGSAEASLVIQVVNVVPTATSAAYSCAPGSSVSNTLNAIDAAGTPFTFSVVGNPSHGTLSLTPATGAFLYTPTSGWEGADSFTFKTNDGMVDSNEGLVTLSVGTAPVSPTYAQAVTGGGAVAYWRLNESSGTTASDAVGTNHATYTQASSGGYTLAQAGALTGDASNTAVALASSGKGRVVVSAVNSALQFGSTQAFSLEAWVKETASQTNDPIFQRGKGSAADSIRLYLNGQKLVLAVRNASGTASTYTSTTSLSLGAWHHVVATCVPNGGAGSVKFFIDGAQDATTGTAPADLYSPADTAFNLGLYNRTTTAQIMYFTGSLDEMAVYATALSLADVQTHYARRSVPSVLVSSPAGGTHLAAPATFDLTATVTANGATVNKVEFFEGATLLGSDTTSPYTLSFSGVAASQMLVKARVTYNTTQTVESPTAWIGIDAPPTANPGSFSGNENQDINGTLTGSSAANGFPLTYSIITQPAHGTVALTSATGAFTCTPSPYWNGNDSFTFKVNNGIADSNTATISLTVAAVNYPPTFTTNPFDGPAARRGLAYGGSLVGSGSDPDPENTISFSKVSGPSWLAVASNGTLSGTPGAGDIGLNSFTVRITDNQAASADATLRIVVNDPPVFTTNPTSAAVIASQNASFTAVASGSPAPALQWQSSPDGTVWTNISGATTTTYTALNSGMADNGMMFRCSATNAAGSAVSTSATLTVGNPVWINAAGGAWPTGSCWLAGVVANGPGSVADFSTLDLTADTTVALNGSRTIGGLRFADTTPTNNWILSTGTGGPLTLDVPGGTPAITVLNQTAMIGAVLAGTKGASKEGAGTLTLTAINTFTGGLVVNGGTVNLQSGDYNFTVAAGNTITINNGATVNLVNTNVTNNSVGFVVNAGGTLTCKGYHEHLKGLTLNGGTVTGSGSGKYNGDDFLLDVDVTVGGTTASTLSLPNGMGLPATRTFTVADTTGDAGGDLIVSGAGTLHNSDGTGGLVKAGPGTMVLNARANCTGGTTINQGTLQLGWAGSGPGALCNTVTVNAGATLHSTIANTFGWSGVNASVTTLNIVGGTVTHAAGLPQHFWGQALNMTGGTLDLAGASQFGGAGTKITVSAAATTARITGTGTMDLRENLTSNILEFQVADGTPVTDLQIDPPLTYTASGGVKGVTKTGAGRMVLGGACTYTGATSVNAGTIVVNGSLGASSTVAVAGGATLAGTGTIGGATAVNGTLEPGDNSVGTLTFGSALTLSGSSSVLWEVSDWTAAGADKLVAPSAAITATSASPVNIVISERSLVNFSETNASFVLCQASGGISGFDAAKFSLNTSGFTSGAGTWSIQQSGNNILLAYARPNTSPTFPTNPILVSASQGTAVSGFLTATDPDLGETLTYTKSSGPAWLTVAADGALSGSPGNADVGSNSFSVRVTDAGGLHAEATLDVVVANTNDEPTFASPTLTGAGATQGTAYAATLAGTATDPDTPYGETLVFSKVSGPDWLAVAADGALSGTPGNADVGSNSFTVRVTDAGGLHAEATLSIEVIAVITNPDANANGILDTWETEKFGNAASGSNPADGDPDHDGLTNLMEFALDTSPTTPNPAPLDIATTDLSGAPHLQLTVHRNPAATNLVYVVEGCSDLASGMWTSTGLTVATNEAGLLVVRDNTAVTDAPHRFLRLRVQTAP